MSGFRLAVTTARLLALDGSKNIKNIACVGFIFDEVRYQVECL